MIKRIVLTGGPCAGKTTALSLIEQDLCEKGYKVFIVGESATELIKGGITPFASGVGLLNFQKLIMTYQYQKEEVYNRAVMETKDEDIVIIYDRGLLDNKSYVNEIEFEEILDYLSKVIGKKVTYMDIVSRYDMVIHLVTSAGNKGYTLENNQARTESEEEAILLDKRTMNSWITHNNLQIVDNTLNFDDKMNKVKELIHNCLGRDGTIKKERKFIVDVNVNSDLICLLSGEVSEIEQYYIQSGIDGCETRLRKTTYKYGSNYYYVIQNSSINGTKKVLMEKKINESEFNRLTGNNVQSVVNKKRISFTYEKQFCKLDIFSDGLMLLEIAVVSDKDDIVIPCGFTVLEEVTDCEEYKNINLSAEPQNNRKRKVRI